jgi:disulfide bond formation protein DsbB
MAEALIIAVLAAAAPLLAWGSEGWFGLAPCALCLWQRWPYWAAAGLALLAVPLPPVWRGRLVAAAAIAVLGSGAVAAFHLGVEQGWWPSPLPGCLAPRAGAGATVDELLRSLAPAPTKPCDAPTYLLPPVPLSMAGMNLLYALGLGGIALIWAARRAGRS